MQGSRRDEMAHAAQGLDPGEIAAWVTHSEAAIKEFAASVGVSPGIVVGRLQHERHVPHSHCNDLKLRLEWAPLGPAVA